MRQNCKICIPIGFKQEVKNLDSSVDAMLIFQNKLSDIFMRKIRIRKFQEDKESFFKYYVPLNLSKAHYKFFITRYMRFLLYDHFKG